MRAVQYSSYGGPEVLTIVDAPEPLEQPHTRGTVKRRHHEPGRGVTVAFTNHEPRTNQRIIENAEPGDVAVIAIAL